MMGLFSTPNAFDLDVGKSKIFLENWNVRLIFQCRLTPNKLLLILDYPTTYKLFNFFLTNFYEMAIRVGFEK